MRKKLNRLIAITTITLLIVMQIGPVWAQTAPEPPSAPDAPTAPEEPDEAPEAPEEPEAPDAPSAPGDNSEEQEEEKSTEQETQTQSQEPTTEEETSINDNSAQENNDTTGDTGSTADGQVGDPSITTGDATNTAVITTQANTNTAVEDDCLECGAEGAVVKNSANGADSDNSGSVVTTDDNSTIQNNGANVINDLEQDTNTGDNSASGNVGNSSIDTGDANTSGTLLTAVNTNIEGVAVSEFNVIDDHLGDIILDFSSNCVSGCGDFDAATVENIGNGSDSDNQALIEESTNDVTLQNNIADIINDMVLLSDTGNNTTDNNTGGDSTITSGDANISANSLTFANNNLSGNVLYNVVNIFGDLVGDIIFPDELLAYQAQASNTGNGSGSNNISEIDLENLDQTYQFNVADISNNLELIATTGDNQTSKNTGGNSSIETGDANIDAQVLNVANSNLDGGVWWLVIINEAGNWVGKLFGAPDGANYAGSSGTEFQVDGNGGITAVNSGNGSDSQNDANISQESNSTTTQTNTANIQNNLKLTANTGDNSASRNTGGDSSISTGDANIVANLVNFVNNNITGGGKLFVNVVNVFGSWIGDFLSPGYTKEQSSNQDSFAQGGVTGGSSQSNSSSGDSSSEGNDGGDNGSSSASGGGQLLSQALNTGFVNTKVAGFSTLNSLSAFDDAGTVVNEDSDQITAAKKVININLAWLLLLLPALVLIRIIRRKFIAARIPKA